MLDGLAGRTQATVRPDMRTPCSRSAVARALSAASWPRRLLPAWLAVMLAASPLPAAFAQDTYVASASSPEGTAEVRKFYTRRQLIWEMELVVKGAQPGKDFTNPLLVGVKANRSGIGDGVVAGWMGETKVVIGVPEGDKLNEKPFSVHGVDITYVHYEPDLAATAPRRVEQVELANVRYDARTVLTDRGVDCILTMTGTDGRVFGDVSVAVTGPGILREREGSGRSLGMTILTFSATRLPGNRSPSLTLTRAKLDGSAPNKGGVSEVGGPSQKGQGLSYGGYNFKETGRLFNALRDGSYKVVLDLTFGELQVEYLVRTPVTALAAAAYQQCEARTWIFKQLIGSELSRPGKD